jgi:hypothetical protein
MKDKVMQGLAMAELMKLKSTEMLCRIEIHKCVIKLDDFSIISCEITGKEYNSASTQSIVVENGLATVNFSVRFTVLESASSIAIKLLKTYLDTNKTAKLNNITDKLYWEDNPVLFNGIRDLENKTKSSVDLTIKQIGRKLENTDLVIINNCGVNVRYNPFKKNYTLFL